MTNGIMLYIMNTIDIVIVEVQYYNIDVHY